MSSVFVSHVAEDAAIALEIAFGLEDQGYTTWCYELDSIPGPSHLAQTLEAIGECDAMVLLISSNSVQSHEITTELTRGQDQSKPIIPLLHGITHENLMRQRAEWGERLGSATCLDVGRDIQAAMPRLVRGLEFYGVQPAQAHSAKEERLSSIQREIAVHGGRIHREAPRREQEPSGGGESEPTPAAEPESQSGRLRLFPGGARHLDGVGGLVERLLRTEGLQTQVLKQGDTLVVQGRQPPEQSWKRVLKTTFGLDIAVSVTLSPKNEDLELRTGAGKWMDKAIGGTIGALVFWPAAVTAGYGVYKQHQLFTRIERDVEAFLAGRG